jgi:hypothetical protein
VESCGDTQGLVRNFLQPSSIEYNFMSQPTPELSDHGQARTEHEFTSNRRRLPVVRSSDFVERSRSARRSCGAPRKLIAEKRGLSFHGVALSLLSESLARALVGVPGK